jgi:hypothetical protein
MVCWKVPDVSSIVEVLILLLLLSIVIDVPVAIEHAVALVLAIWVIHFLAVAIWLHLAA